MLWYFLWFYTNDCVLPAYCARANGTCRADTPSAGLLLPFSSIYLLSLSSLLPSAQPDLPFIRLEIVSSFSSPPLLASSPPSHPFPLSSLSQVKIDELMIFKNNKSSTHYLEPVPVHDPQVFQKLYTRVSAVHPAKRLGMALNHVSKAEIRGE